MEKSKEKRTWELVYNIRDWYLFIPGAKKPIDLMEKAYECTKGYFFFKDDNRLRLGKEVHKNLAYLDITRCLLEKLCSKRVLKKGRLLHKRQLIWLDDPDIKTIKIRCDDYCLNMHNVLHAFEYILGEVMNLNMECPEGWSWEEFAYMRGYYRLENGLEITSDWDRGVRQQNYIRFTKKEPEEEVGEND